MYSTLATRTICKIVFLTLSIVNMKVQFDSTTLL